MNHEERLAAIERIPSFIQAQILEAEGNELIDILGAANSTQTQIGVIKRRAASEVSDGDAGTKWAFTQGRKAQRSYNMDGMLSAISRALDLGSFSETLKYLIRIDVLRISWQWSNLDKLVRSHNIELRTTRHEIHDGDPDYEMGEYWEAASPSYEAVIDDG